MKSIANKLFCIAFAGVLSGCAASQSSNSGETLTCEQHATVAKYLNDWAKSNFEESYGKKGDVSGAEVQLFVIQQKAPSQYASAFNRYQDKAAENLALAKKKNCDTSNYPLPPVDEFKNQIDTLKKK